MTLALSKRLKLDRKLGPLGASLGVSNRGVSPGMAGWLSTTSAVFDYVNYAKQSSAFLTAPWGTYGNVVAAPTLTANQGANPVTGNQLWKMSLPAVSGANAASLLYQVVTSSAPVIRQGMPVRTDVYLKGAVGGEIIWLAIQLSDNSFYARTKVTLTTSVVRYSLIYQAHATLSQTLHIGVNLLDGSQTSTPAQDIFISDVQIVQDQIAWPQVNTTTTQSAVQQVTQTLPAGIAFRDFSTLSASGISNPVLPQNTAAWNVQGTDSPKVDEANKVGATYFCYAETNDGTAPGHGWNKIAVYATTDRRSFSAPGSNPILSRVAGTWQDNYLLHPNGVTISGTTYVAYSAQTAAGVSSIGISTTTDPLNGPYAQPSSPVITGFGQGTPHMILAPDEGLIYMFVSMECSGVSTSGITINYYTCPIASDPTVAGNWTFGGIALRKSTSDWDYAASPSNQQRIEASVYKNRHGFYEMPWCPGQGTGPAFYQSIGLAIAKKLSGPWFTYQAAAIIAGTPSNYEGDCIFNEPGDGKFEVFYAGVLSLTDTQGYLQTMTAH